MNYFVQKCEMDERKQAEAKQIGNYETKVEELVDSKALTTERLEVPQIVLMCMCYFLNNLQPTTSQQNV